MNIESFVASLHAPNQVAVVGFEACDSATHMIEWIRKGKDFRTFVVHDIEGELYAQDRDSQLMSVHCKAPPVLETKVRPGAQVDKGIVTNFFVAFPLALRARSSDGRVWILEVSQGYQASGLDTPDSFQLRMNFTIEGSKLEE